MKTRTGSDSNSTSLCFAQRQNLGVGVQEWLAGQTGTNHMRQVLMYSFVGGADIPEVSVGRDTAGVALHGSLVAMWITHLKGGF